MERPANGTETTIASRDAVRREQLRQVRSGCGCVVLLVGSVAALGTVEPLFRWLSRPSAEAVLIDNFGQMSGALLWGGSIAGVVLLAALGARSARRAALGASLVLVIAGVFFHRFVYGDFCTLEVVADEITLGYAWPRPAARLSLRSLRRAEVVRAWHEETRFSRPRYRLELDTPEGRWISQSTANRDMLEGVRWNLERRSRRP